MKLRIISVVSFLAVSLSGFAQFKGDMIVAGAVATEAGILKASTEKTNGLQAMIMGTQTVIAGQLETLKGVEDKMMKYLSKTQGVINNLYDIKRSLDLGSSILKNLNACKDAAANHPDRAVISTLMSRRTTDIILESTALASSIGSLVTKSGKDNLLNSAERTRILSDVTGRLSTINRQLRSLKYQIIMFRWTDVVHRFYPVTYADIIGSEYILNKAKRNVDQVARIF